MSMTVQKFEPVFLTPQEPAKLTEYGKSWFDARMEAVSKHIATLRDVAKLGALMRERWAEMEAALVAEGVPVAVTSGISQYGMSHLLDHINGKVAFPMPAVVALALGTAAPTSTTTGATLAEPTYTGYGAQTILAAGFNPATSATPSVSTNNGAITGANCTAGTSTLLGFLVKDSASAGAGNALWYGTLPSTVISTVQTPWTVANTAMSLSMTGT